MARTPRVPTLGDLDLASTSRRGFLRPGRRRARPRRRARSRRETQSPASSNRRRRRRRRCRRPRRRRGIPPSERSRPRPRPPPRVSSPSGDRRHPRRPRASPSRPPEGRAAPPARSSPPRDGPRRSKPRAKGHRTPNPSCAARWGGEWSSPRVALLTPSQSMRFVSSEERLLLTFSRSLEVVWRRRSLANVDYHRTSLNLSLRLSFSRSPGTRHARLPPPPRPAYSLPRNLPHIESNSLANTPANLASRAMTTFSWLPSTACLVQLKLPLMRVAPSTMANLWCMCVDAASVLTGMPASAMARRSDPVEFAPARRRR